MRLETSAVYRPKGHDPSESQVEWKDVADLEFFAADVWYITG